MIKDNWLTSLTEIILFSDKYTGLDRTEATAWANELALEYFPGTAPKDVLDREDSALEFNQNEQ
jgi:hypothetical protein